MFLYTCYMQTMLDLIFVLHLHYFINQVFRMKYVYNKTYLRYFQPSLHYVHDTVAILIRLIASSYSVMYVHTYLQAIPYCCRRLFLKIDSAGLHHRLVGFQKNHQWRRIMYQYTPPMTREEVCGIAPYHLVADQEVIQCHRTILLQCQVTTIVTSLINPRSLQCRHSYVSVL